MFLREVARLFFEVALLSNFVYSVMQSDRNSLKIDTFQEAITSELMIYNLKTENSYSSVIVSSKV